MADPIRPPCPPSATSLGTNLTGLAALLVGAVWALRAPDEIPSWVLASVLMAVAAAPILALDLLVHRVHARPSTGLDWSRPRPVSWSRVLHKWLGGAAAVGAVVSVYWLAREYRGDFYDDYYRFLRAIAPVVVIGGAAYIAILDRYLVDPKDGYWHLGQLVRLREADASKAAEVLRGWAVKGFFLALMFTYAVHDVSWLRRLDLANVSGFVQWYDVAYRSLFFVDVVFATLGYVLSFRVFDTHLRSTEPTTFGWLVALVCYQPFWTLVSGQYVYYFSDTHWDVWLRPYPLLQWAWGITILALLFVYAGATLSFGCRFSNLTHRGIVTNGFYRYTKHPAYVSKSLAFFFIHIPFVTTGGWQEGLRMTCAYLVGSGIYALRAWTEERHLSRDPAYVAYALWMNEHGAFARLGRWIPALRYRPPADVAPVALRDPAVR